MQAGESRARTSPCRRWALLVSLVAALCCVGAGAPSRPVAAQSQAVTLTWLRVDAAQASTVYAGGYQGTLATCIDPANYLDACALWASRSRDRGATWQRPLGDIAAVVPSYASQFHQCANARSPLMLSPDGREAFVISQGLCSATGAASYLFRSPDSGVHWYRAWQDIDRLQAPGFPNGIDFFAVALAISPSMPRRVYLTGYPAAPGGYALFVLRSDDGGVHWQYVIGDPLQIDGIPLGELFPAAIVADPSAASIAYLGLTQAGTTVPVGVPTVWARSEDSGVTWHFLTPPAGPAFLRYSTLLNLPYTSFTIVTDPHLPGRIVAQLIGTGIPADRRYVSADHGRTWKAIHCPGDLRGQCPAYTLDNVFGAGRNYGFYKDGVHAFTGAGPAGPKLALSNRLPCKTSALIDVGGGHTAGAPAYLLCQDPAVPLATAPGYDWTLDQNPNLSGILYRSIDGGKSWQRLHPAGAH